MNQGRSLIKMARQSTRPKRYIEHLPLKETPVIDLGSLSISGTPSVDDLNDTPIPMSPSPPISQIYRKSVPEAPPESETETETETEIVEEVGFFDEDLQHFASEHQDLPSNQPSRIHQEPIPESIRQFLLSVNPQPQRLPFLRRNVRLSFETVFLASRNKVKVLVRRIHQAQNARLPSVYWSYKFQDPETREYLKWEIMQESWRCQLCNVFPAFSHKDLLLFHIRKDHSEFDVHHRKRGDGSWRLDVDLLPSPSPSPVDDTWMQIGSPVVIPSAVDSILDNESSTLVNTQESNAQPLSPVESIEGLRRFRVGGLTLADTVMCEMQVPLHGIALQAFEEREEEIMFFSNIPQEFKSLALMWKRWIAQYRREFLDNPFMNLWQFIERNFDLINRTSGHLPLFIWLLNFKKQRHLEQEHLTNLMKHYQTLQMKACASL
ncbi:hypothetical protein CPB86DRAFT_40970 [Serendipita vermifera]|nr:hypothetical protein CPB86DRAFT_40970 [Serendipita vermifera]